MSQIAAFARMKAHPGRRDELVDALEPYLAKSASEPGTVAYILHISSQDPDTVWLYTRFADQDALDEHQKGEAAHPIEVSSRMAGLIASIDFEIGAMAWNQED